MAAAKNPAVRDLRQRVAGLETSLVQFRLEIIPFLLDVAFNAGRDSLTNPKKFTGPRPTAGPRHWSQSPLILSGAGNDAAPAPVPAAWRIVEADVAARAATGKVCETRRCRNPQVIVTWRYFRSQGRVLLAEHEVCEQHAQEFARRHRIPVDPPAVRAAHWLTEAEVLERVAAGEHCSFPGCRHPAVCIFTGSYSWRGVPEVDERLACDRDTAAPASACFVEIGPPRKEGGRL